MDNIDINTIEVKGADSIVITTPISATDLVAQQQAIIDNERSNIDKWNAAIAQRVIDTASDTQGITDSQIKITTAQAIIDKVTPALT